jgi:hypothetical protein
MEGKDLTVYETVWRAIGVFIFIYSGVMNALLLIVFIASNLYAFKMPQFIIKRKYGKYLVKVAFSSMMGLSVGFMIYSAAEKLASAYNSWIHYVVIAFLAYIVYRYRLLPFTNRSA